MGANVAGMARQHRRTDDSFGEELRRLLEERGVSFRKFAAAVGVPQPYLSRTMSGERPPSTKLLANAAAELGLPHDYFVEYRARVVIEAVRTDGRLRDRVYDELTRSRSA